MAQKWDAEIPNPLDRNRTNPLTYHDARLDKQNSLFELVNLSNSPNRATYLKLLLNNPTVDPSFGNNRAFIEACSQGKLDLVEILLNDHRIDISDMNNQAIRSVASKNHLINSAYTKIFKLILSRLELNHLFLDAVDKGNQTLVNHMLQDPRVIPGTGRMEALRRAIAKGHTEIFKILANNPKVNMMKANNSGLSYLAVIRNRPEILNIILSKLNLDLRYVESQLMQEAASRGYTDIMNRLLQDPRIDPSYSRNYAIYIASQKGHLGIVERLLQHPLVDPSDLNNRALYTASVNHHTSVVEKLLQNYNVLTKASLTRSLDTAAFFGHRDVESLLRQAKERRRHIRWNKRLEKAKNIWRRITFEDDV